MFIGTTKSVSVVWSVAKITRIAEHLIVIISVTNPVATTVSFSKVFRGTTNTTFLFSIFYFEDQITRRVFLNLLFNIIEFCPTTKRFHLFAILFMCRPRCGLVLFAAVSSLMSWELNYTYFTILQAEQSLRFSVHEHPSTSHLLGLQNIECRLSFCIFSHEQGRVLNKIFWIPGLPATQARFQGLALSAWF